MREELFSTWDPAEALDLARESCSYVARVLPFDADLEALGAADRVVLEVEEHKDMEAYEDALRELMRTARAQAMRERAGAAA
jgi:hypothetical protein